MSGRLAVATWFVWAATWIAPKPLSPILGAYAKMLRQFPRELASGRTYGVVVVPWHSTSAGAINADHMQLRAMDAAALARSKMPPDPPT